MQKNKICFLGLVIFLVAHGTYSFDVKVLLQKFDMSELQKNPVELVCDTGFVLSAHAKLALGSEFLGNRLVFSYKNEKLLLNGTSLKENIVNISPMLSAQHQGILKSKISCWLEMEQAQLHEHAEMLHALFENMVASDQTLDASAYGPINGYMADVCDMFLDDIVEGLATETLIEPVTLSGYVQDCLGTKAQKTFINLLKEKHPTSEYRKILQADIKKRNAFFNAILDETTDRLLTEVVFSLPRKFLQQIVGEPVEMISFEGNKYFGSFIICHEKRQLFVINSVDIEDYLLSVVRHEGWASWPHEMQKVVAISCRTYLVWQVLQAQKTVRPYHVENTNKHQTYKGYYQCPKLKQAVDETRDVIISFQGKPALTMYDSCCGGIIPSNIDDPGYRQVSYLARTYPCTFCKSYKVFNWRLEFSYEEMLKRLKKEYSKMDKITDLYVQKKDKAGLVRKIMIVSGVRRYVITVKKMKQLFPELRSSCFDITKAHRRYIIEGRGFGHHRGLCQWGASHLIKHEGWQCADVLQFYYPGTGLMKLKYQR